VFTVRKIDDSSYEIRMKASIRNDWHIYEPYRWPAILFSPVKISLRANPLVAFDDTLIEIHKLCGHAQRSFGIEQYEYVPEVDFILGVHRRYKVKLTISGNVIFEQGRMGECLPDVEFPFRVAL
jgi:hypothetical protein